jgi:hypothetical protein
MRRSGGAIAGAGIVAAMMVIGACSSGGGGTSDTRKPGTTTTTAPAITGVQVNLTITGDRTATIQGTKGSCSIPPFGSATYAFGGADYPSLGANGSLSVAGPLEVNGSTGVPASVKVVIGDVGLLSPANGSGITISNNERVVMINTPISGGTGQSEDINLTGPEASVHAQLVGTIRCTTGK